MFVRLKQGRDAGTVTEMKYIDAQPLLADGRAEFAYPPDTAPAAACVVEARASVSDSAEIKPKKGKRK